MPPRTKAPEVERPVTIELSIKLSNHHYESSLSVPLDHVAQMVDEIGEWLQMQERYLRALRPGERVNVNSRHEVKQGATE